MRISGEAVCLVCINKAAPNLRCLTIPAMAAHTSIFVGSMSQSRSSMP